MMNPFNVSRRVIALAVVLAVALMLATAGLATAAPAQPQDVTPPPRCLSATPATQTVGVGQTAKVTISATSCKLPPQPVVEANIVVSWGDGAVSTYPYCMEVCYVSVVASHAYKAVGDYHPSICLTVPTPTPQTISCTSVEIKVLLVPTA